jgi:hypothetical protein
MIDPIKKLRQTLFSIHKLSYRIKAVAPPRDLMDKKLFIEIIDTLKKIEDRKDFLQDEIGMDMTVYEDQFFLVIENLIKLHFSEEQQALIRLYLYELRAEDDWDGTITIERDNNEKVVQFKTAADLWKIISSL